MVLQAWAIMLAALASFRATTANFILDYWDFVNGHLTELHTFDDVDRELKFMRESIGIDVSLKRVQPSDIRTQGDLNRFIKVTRHNEMATAIAILAEPTLRLKYFDYETLCYIFHKVLDLNEEIAAGMISIRDIQDMLIDEYGLFLEAVGSTVRLSLIEILPAELSKNASNEMVQRLEREDNPTVPSYG